MRQRIRIQPYVFADTHRKLRAYAAAMGVTDSAVAESALCEFFDRNKSEEPVLLRRFDSVVQMVAQLRSDLDVLSQAFGIFARYSFLGQPLQATKQDQDRADGLYKAFLCRISTEVAAGVRFVAEVNRARKTTQTPRPDTTSLQTAPKAK